MRRVWGDGSRRFLLTSFWLPPRFVLRVEWGEITSIQRCWALRGTSQLVGADWTRAVSDPPPRVRLTRIESFPLAHSCTSFALIGSGTHPMCLATSMRFPGRSSVHSAIGKRLWTHSTSARKTKTSAEANARRARSSTRQGAVPSSRLVRVPSYPSCFGVKVSFARVFCARSLLPFPTSS